MTEETLNQEENLFDDAPEVEEGNLFDDGENEEVEETGTPTEETTESNEQSNGEEKPQEEAQPFLDIEYLKETKHLTKEEAKTLAQKGMDYDRIRGGYDFQKQYQKSVTELESLAKANNQTLDEFSKEVVEIYKQMRIDNEVERLKQENPEGDEKLLRKLAEANLKEPEVKETPNDPLKEKLDKQVKEFENVYPNVDWGKLPEEVINKMQEGKTMLEAYQSHLLAEKEKEIKELQEKVKVKEKNDKNMSKSVGNITNAGKEEADLFEDAFEKAFL